MVASAIPLRFGRELGEALARARERREEIEEKGSLGKCGITRPFKGAT